MKKPEWKFLVDNLLVVCTLGMAAIGILLWLVIPEGPAAGEASKYFLGLHRHAWGHIHAYLAIAFVVLLVVHLVLNWDWITCMAKRAFRKAWVPGLLLTVVLTFLVLLLFWLFSPASPGGQAGRRGGHRGQSGTSLSERP